VNDILSEDYLVKEHHSIGLVAGLILITVMLFMLFGPQGVLELMQMPQASYELAGSSKPTK
jgi:hypothetical protein